MLNFILIDIIETSTIFSTLREILQFHMQKMQVHIALPLPIGNFSGIGIASSYQPRIKKINWEKILHRSRQLYFLEH